MSQTIGRTRPRMPIRIAALLALPLFLVSCQARPTPRPWPTWTPKPTATVPAPTPTWTPRPTATVQPTVTPSPTAEQAPVVAAPLEEAPRGPLATSLTVAQTEGQPTIYYAVVDGRLYGSKNSGFRWYVPDRTGLPDGSQCLAVAADPGTTGITYVATTEGIFRRQTKGAWSQVSTLRAMALAVSPADPNVVWAGGEEGVLRSSDGGVTWTPVNDGLDAWQGMGIQPSRTWVSDVVIDPANPEQLWAVQRLETTEQPALGLVYRRGGDGRWQRLSLGLYEPAPGNLDSVTAAGIMYDPVAKVLFLGSERCPFNRGRLPILRSSNGGDNWEMAARLAAPTSACLAPGWARPLFVSTEEPRTLFLSASITECGSFTGNRLLVSRDNGTTWSQRRLVGVQ